jgi:phosphoserine phosphatase
MWLRVSSNIVKMAQKFILPAVSSNHSLNPFAKRIGAQVIGTPVEIVNGRVKMVGELMANEKKIEQVSSRLGVDRVDMAYGDTILDVPLLEHADHPVAVYPDAKLKVIALERGWEIIGDTPKVG